MDFDFSDDQLSLRDAVARWVDKGFDFDRRRTLAREGGYTRAIWEELAELGLTGLTVPPDDGGLGLGPIEAMVVMEELGRGLVHAPYAAAALVVPSILAAAAETVRADWLPRIASGEALVVLAHQERAARYRLDQVAARAQESATGWRLEGLKSVVPAGDEADAFVVPAHTAHGIRLFLVERAQASVRGYPTQDGGRAADVLFDQARAHLVAAEGLLVLERAIDVGIAATCAEAVGLMERLVAMTVDYLNTRKQFGAPLASFQALRHRMADVKMQLELARSMSYYASLKLGEPAAQRRRALAQAKVQLGHSMRFVSQQCLQMHGGIGMTDEYAGSHYFKRLAMLELAYGDSLHHLGEVSARMQDTAGVFA
jgi:alkylation response protein AidB-like acyl-CoA dehydrogenase